MTHQGYGWACQVRVNVVFLPFICSYWTPRLVEPLQTDHEALEESPCHGQSPVFGECWEVTGMGGRGTGGCKSAGFVSLLAKGQR